MDGKELLADQNVSIANPDFCPVFLYFYDGTDFAYIGRDILCLFECYFLSICFI